MRKSYGVLFDNFNNVPNNSSNYDDLNRSKLFAVDAQTLVDNV